MRTKTGKSKKTRRSAERGRRGSTCELCAHEDDTPCSATCVKGLDNPLVTNAISFQRRSPHLTAFYCQCAQLHGELHRASQQPVAETFQEDVVRELGHSVLARFEQLLDYATHGGEDEEENAPPLCPFVMLLSILLPSLRKYLDWVVLKTRSTWAFPDASSSSHASAVTPVALTASASSTAAFFAMLALHDALMNVIAECEKLAHVIELNEHVDDEHVYARAKAVAPGAATVPPAAPMRIPQIKKISREFGDLVAEYKCQLAELTESILEVAETSASRMCRPLTSKDASKARGSVTEYMELLVLQLLDPIRKRAVAAPSPSRTYLTPRIFERCITVLIDEFVLDNVKMNEILAAQFEKGVAFLRSWSLQFEAEYNNFAKQRVASISHRNSESQLTAVKEALESAQMAPPSSSSSRSVTSGLRLNLTKLDGTNSGFSSSCSSVDGSSANERLVLASLDGFKRLENVLNAWLRGSSRTEEEALSARTRVMANLGGLRTTIVRSISTKTR